MTFGRPPFLRFLKGKRRIKYSEIQKNKVYVLYIIFSKVLFTIYRVLLFIRNSISVDIIET